MTREEAKELLVHILMTYEPKDQYGDLSDPEPYEEAVDMAIEALQTEVVRCNDCKHKVVTEDGEYDPEDIVCEYWMSDGLNSNDYCSYGERKE